MTRLEKWILRRIVAKEVRQGVDHDFRIAGLYGEIRGACEYEFCEDSDITLDLFLLECFELTQSRFYRRTAQLRNPA